MTSIRELSFRKENNTKILILENVPDLTDIFAFAESITDENQKNLLDNNTYIFGELLGATLCSIKDLANEQIIWQINKTEMLNQAFQMPPMGNKLSERWPTTLPLEDVALAPEPQSTPQPSRSSAASASSVPSQTILKSPRIIHELGGEIISVNTLGDIPTRDPNEHSISSIQKNLASIEARFLQLQEKRKTEQSIKS